MADSTKDLFSGHSDIYAKYRPLYPKELYDFILKQVSTKDIALDCGTGNGQAAGVLAEHFKQVHATDISDKQIKNAIQKPNLHYHVCKAEKTPFSDDTFDLITSATAVHWFHFERFFSEMKRIGKNNSVFACWGYKLFRTDNTRLNEIVDAFYTQKIHSYWDAERRHVDEEYKNIPFPFEEIENPGFATHLQWDLKILEGYLNTWSAVQHYIKKNDANPVIDLMDEIKTQLPGDIRLKITFPIFMRIGIIKK
ncbi:MAG TPA: class I SAM-dependent methyltransferase [Chitinophagaceae bacterium]|jgi:ubiquinone/menaquinone biosynthesis C-methylase UbiE|nr:class I SAM-dependent methyltransferase [Chitinophagaceae bacterium]